MRASGVIRRGAKGYGWYNKFLNNGQEGFRRFKPPTAFDWSAGNVTRPSAYFDVSLDNEPIGRLTFELAEDVVPTTVMNFKKLCANSKDKGELSYENTVIHRIMKNSALVGGDVENHDGSGGHSALGSRHFEDENFIIPHTDKGLLSMMSSGIDTNGSQFCLSLEPLPHLNGRSVVFGRLVEGDDVLAIIQEVFTFRGKPAKEVKIANAGVIE